MPLRAFEKAKRRSKSNTQEENDSQSLFFDKRADVPVPDRLLPAKKSKRIYNQLKLSQMIGLLLFLNRNNEISYQGEERLIWLQSKASIDALSAAVSFLRRLETEDKLKSDFRHQLIESNRFPHSRRFRLSQTSRIGVGYRDKGTLLPNHKKGPRESDSEGVVFIYDLPPVFQNLVEHLNLNPENGEWVDLGEVRENPLQGLHFG